MADGELTVTLNAETALRLKAAADAVGVPVDDYTQDLIAGVLEEDWAEDCRRAAEYDRTGEYVSVEDAFRAARADLEAKLAAKKLAGKK